MAGSISGIGLTDTLLHTTSGAQKNSQSLGQVSFDGAVSHLLDWIRKQSSTYQIGGIGHRVVHGGQKYVASAAVSPEMLTELRRIVPFDPLHLPMQIHLIEQIQAAFADIPQFASFDTAFHKDLPTVARLFALPRTFEAAGIRRYGFHGLSYSFLLTSIEQTYGAEAAKGRLILAHLGNGASLAAVNNGKSVDTSMGFTPAGGVPMSTRSGDIDPGVLTYLAQQPGWDGKHLDSLVNSQSGLLGISGTTADMKVLLEQESTDSRAADAVNIFCYHIKKTIGAYVAALGGIDRLVFTGGMGEDAPKIRARVAGDLAYLGIEINEARNNGNEVIISSDTSRVPVNVIPTDEALTIARDIVRLATPPLTQPKEGTL